METSEGRQVLSVTRYALIAASLLLAVAQWIAPPDASNFESITARVLYAIVYGFVPALVGYLIATIRRSFVGLGGKKQSNVSADWHWAWGVLLALLVAAQALKAGPPT